MGVTGRFVRATATAGTRFRLKDNEHGPLPDGGGPVFLIEETIMAKRYVRRTGKDRNGDITKLCNDGDAWSPRLKADAIYDIEHAIHGY